MASGSLSDDDIKFVLSVDPDQDALNKAIQQINADIEKAQVAKIRLELEKMWKPPDDVVPVSFWEKKFGHAGEALRKEFELAADTLREMKIGADPDVLRQRIANEREVAAVRKDLERAEQREREKQAGGSMNLLREQMGADPQSVRERMKREQEQSAVRKEIQKIEHEERVKQAGGKMAYFGQQVGGMLSPGGDGGGLTMSNLGGAAGMAMGGPAGAAVGEVVGGIVGKLGEAIPTAIAAPARVVNFGLTAVQDALQGLQGPLGPVGVSLNALSGGLGLFGKAVGAIPLLGGIVQPLIDQLAMIPNILKGILESMVSLTQKAAPGVVHQLTLATEDFQATVGQSFTPVVEFVTDAVRGLADVMAAMLPTAQEWHEALVPLREVWASVQSSMRDTAPSIHKGLVTVLKIVMEAIAAFVGFLENMSKKIWGAVVTENLGDWGAKPESGQEAISAVRTPWMGGMEEYQRKLQMTALEHSAGGRTQLTAESVPQNVNNIATMVANIEEWFNNFSLKQIVRDVADAIKEGAGEVTREAINSASESVSEGFKAGIGFGPLMGG